MLPLPLLLPLLLLPLLFHFVSTAFITTTTAAAVAMDSYWETKAPPTSVLGPFLSKQSSGSIGVMSFLFFTIGVGCVVANDAGLPNVNPAFVLGSELTPISWGLHVASWILKENGK